MKKDLFKTIEIPEGVEVNVKGGVVSVKGSEGELKREFNVMKLELKKEGNSVVVGSKKATKTEKKNMNTIAAHIENLIKGVQEKFEYKLKVCFSHFPISVEVEGKEATIKNFLGEKIARHSKILEGVDVDVQKNIITVTGNDKELTGQTAANFEKATRISLKDRRIFQDGIFITHKPGRVM